MVRTTAMCVALAAVTLGSVVAGCSGEEAVPIDPANPPVLETDPPSVTHLIPATPQMEEFARRQCLDDPSLEQGYVEAVDPETGDVLSDITVECAEVRAEG